jgi:hypothetical protein
MRHSNHRLRKDGHAPNAVKFDPPKSGLSQQCPAGFHGKEFEWTCIAERVEVPVKLTSKSKGKILPVAMIRHRYKYHAAGLDSVKQCLR